MSSHIAEGLKSKYPDSRLLWLAEPHVGGLLANNPFVDKVVIFNKQLYKKLWSSKKYLHLILEVFRFIKALRAENINIVFDVQGLLRTRVIAWLTGARSRYGFNSKEPGKFLLTNILTKSSLGTRMGNEYYEMLEQIGASCVGLKQKVYEDTKSQRDTQSFLMMRGICKPYIVLAPFTTRPQKHWTDEGWKIVARNLYELHSFEIIWLGGENDRSNAQRLAKESVGVSLAGDTNLMSASIIIGGAVALIGVDTGLTHIGSAYGTPTVAIFGSTCPYTDGNSAKTIVLYSNLVCSPCRRKPICGQQYDCMVSIAPENVISNLMRLLHTETKS